MAADIAKNTPTAGSNPAPLVTVSSKSDGSNRGPGSHRSHRESRCPKAVFVGSAYATKAGAIPGLDRPELTVDYCDPRASEAHLVFHSWRSFHHSTRDRVAICRYLWAGSLSDVCWRLLDGDFLPKIPRMDSLEVCGQPHL
jgi:hypothetical protein